MMNQNQQILDAINDLTKLVEERNNVIESANKLSSEIHDYMQSEEYIKFQELLSEYREMKKRKQPN